MLLKICILLNDNYFGPQKSKELCFRLCLYPHVHLERFQHLHEPALYPEFINIKIKPQYWSEVKGQNPAHPAICLLL